MGFWRVSASTFSPHSIASFLEDTGLELGAVSLRHRAVIVVAVHMTYQSTGVAGFAVGDSDRPARVKGVGRHHIGVEVHEALARYGRRSSTHPMGGVANRARDTHGTDVNRVILEGIIGKHVRQIVTLST